MTLGGLAFPIVQGVFTGNERIASGRVDVELFSPVSFWRRALITIEVLPLDPRQAGAAGCSPDVDTAFIQFTRPTGNHHMINRALTRQAHAKRRSTRLLLTPQPNIPHRCRARTSGRGGLPFILPGLETGKYFRLPYCGPTRHQLGPHLHPHKNPHIRVMPKWGAMGMVCPVLAVLR